MFGTTTAVFHPRPTIDSFMIYSIVNTVLCQSIFMDIPVSKLMAAKGAFTWCLLKITLKG